MIIGFVFFRENHPFTRFPMYSHFPNWAYSFYFCDSQGEPLPAQNYGLTGGALGHQFYSWCQYLDIPYGDARETPEQLQQVADSMLLRVQYLNKTKPQLWRRYFYYQGKQMMHKDERIDRP
jgi:hypothetical protein